MVNTKRKRVASILMAFFVIISSFSFKIEQRFCGYNQSNFSDLNKLKSCCSKVFFEDDRLNIGNTDDVLINQACCLGIEIFFDEQENFQIHSHSHLKFESLSSNSLSLNQKNFDLKNFEDKSKLHYNFCNPPPLIFDKLIYNQVLLI